MAGDTLDVPPSPNPMKGNQPHQNPVGRLERDGMGPLLPEIYQYDEGRRPPANLFEQISEGSASPFPLINRLYPSLPSESDTLFSSPANLKTDGAELQKAGFSPTLGLLPTPGLLPMPKNIPVLMGGQAQLPSEAPVNRPIPAPRKTQGIYF